MIKENLIHNRELHVIQDQDFLLTKLQVIAKIRTLMEQTSVQIRQKLEESGKSQQFMTTLGKAKISKGENYRGLPYMVLDYPSYFSKKNIFAFRTMFWWGNFFSSTLHLQGKYLDLVRDDFIENLKKLHSDKSIYICTGDTPWEYHYGNDNYKLISPGDKELIETHDFLKLSKRFELDQWRDLPVLSSAFILQLNMIMKDNV